MLYWTILCTREPIREGFPAATSILTELLTSIWCLGLSAMHMIHAASGVMLKPHVLCARSTRGDAAHEHSVHFSESQGSAAKSGNFEPLC